MGVGVANSPEPVALAAAVAAKENLRAALFAFGEVYGALSVGALTEVQCWLSELTARTSGRDTASAIPAWARTHPLSAERVTRATGRAQAAGAVRDTPPERTQPYLQAVNGMIYGDDPEQGYVNGRTFAHPSMRIAFEAPQGFTLTNTTTAVVIAGPNNARAQFSGGVLPQEGLEAYANARLRQLIGQARAQIGHPQRSTTNGLETVTIPARAQNQQGQIVDVSVTAYRVNDRAYHFLTLAPQGAGAAMTPMLGSMRTLTTQQAAALRPRRIELVQIGARDTAQSLSRRMAFDDYQLERFLALNGRDSATPLRAGETVKIVTYAR